jgi:translocation and assembly module TamB
VRYRRRRFWAWSGAGVIGLVLLALLAVYWLLQTVAGRDVLLAQVVARLPVGASFTWDKVDGPVAGPLTLYNVDFRYDDIHAERAHLEPDLRPLLGRKLLLDKLELTNATLNLAKSDEPFKLPSWPDSLPQIEMPLAIQADAIAIDGFRISQANEPVIDISRVRGGIEIANGEFQAHKLVVDSDMGNFTAQGRYIPAKDYDTDVTVTAVLPAPRGRTARRWGWWHAATCAHGGGRGRACAEAAARDAGVRRPHRSELECQRAQRRTGSGAAVAGTGQLGDRAAGAGLHRGGKGGNANLRGKVKQGDQELELAPSVVSLQDQVLKVSPLLVKGLVAKRAWRAPPISARKTSRAQLLGGRADLTYVPAPDPNTAGSAPVPVTLKEARFGLAGTLKAWAAIGRPRSNDAHRSSCASTCVATTRPRRSTSCRRTPGGQLQVEARWRGRRSWTGTPRPR